MDILKELELKIDTAIELIAKIRKENETLNKENESLKRQTEQFRSQIEELESRADRNAELLKKNKADFDPVLVKSRLQKLVQQLGALEDTWS
jgi:FtsZ-binding cell division protein ZapB